MSSRNARRRRPTEQSAESTAPVEPDLGTALAKARAETAALVRGLEAHKEQTEVLLTMLNQQELSIGRLVRGLTGILDSFDRLLAHDTDVGVESYRASVHKIAELLVDVLWNNGIELIGRTNEIADPETHRVLEVRDDGDRPKDTVIVVCQRGLRYRGQLLQPASVVVSSGKSAQESSA